MRWINESYFMRKMRWFLIYKQFFADWRSVFSFKRLRVNSVHMHGEVELRLRRKPDAVLWCRAKTTDAAVFWDVFFGKYHLPLTQLPDPAVIFDLGANVGFTAFDYATRYPASRIIAVEMDDENAALARRNLKAVSDNCTVEKAAIWYEDGEISYAKNEEEWGYKADPNLSQKNETALIVRAVTIHTLMQELGVEWIDFMKMDIEGAEDKVIYPGAPFLKKLGVLSLEIHAPATYEKVQNILSAEGFSCQKSSLHPNSLIATRSHADTLAN
ncbi:MAG: FkbM family methyltransferase [Paracoccaceae bacterium]